MKQGAPAMVSNFSRLIFLTVLGLTSMSFAAFAESPLEGFTKDGKIHAEIRYRYEFVDQDGPAPVAKEAQASTMRTNLGLESGKYKGFKGLLEVQFVQHIGADKFNDTVNGRTIFPVVADPENQELNQAWISWDSVPDFEMKLGRQALNIDNQRFVGSVDWRQNDQTFDAMTLAYRGFEKTSLQYGYLHNINRVFGDDHLLGDLDSDSHFLNVSRQFSEAITLTGYGYWLSFKNLPARSSRTFGLRAIGKHPLNDKWHISYEAETAHQTDYKNHPSDYDVSYYNAFSAVGGYGWTFGAGYEVLGGDSANAFQTPLATLHKFNGWADMFLNTPATGLQDARVTVGYKVSGTNSTLDGVQVSVVYHDFSGEERGDLGREIDFSVGKSFNLPQGATPFKKMNLLAKFADYKAEDAPYTDTRKAWIQLGLTF
jgi:hypothetical protein